MLRERHVGRAADRLTLTPSAVSHGLGRLRRPLFLRTPRGVVPTARFGVRSLDPLLALPGFRVNSIAPKVALMDAGLARLFGLLARADQGEPARRERPLLLRGLR